MLFGRGLQGHVDVVHDPVKHACVDVFGKCVTGVGCLFAGHILHIRLRCSDQLPVAEPVLHLLQLHTQQPAEVFQVDVVSLNHTHNTQLHLLEDGHSL